MANIGKHHLQRPGQGLILLLLGSLLWACAPPPPLPKDAPEALAGTPAVVELPDAIPAEVAAQAQSLVDGITDEREKALALYTWIARNIRYDIDAFLTNNLPDPSPGLVYSTRSAVCEGYARLFEAMAESVGLEAVMVSGFSKGFAPGDEASRDEPDHAWNAVKIDGSWQLLDPTWGAGHIDQSKSFVAQFSEDWFCVPPEQFIATHLPSDPKWQILQSPLSANAFWAQPTVTPLFFKYGLRLESHPEGEVSLSGPLEMHISSEQECRLMASVYQDSQQLPDSHALVERRGKDFTVAVSAPGPGDYQLILFAGPPDSDRTESAAILELNSLSSGEAFPKTMKSFTDREVHLVSPRGSLQQGRSSELVVEAPGATKMMAVMGEAEIPFEKEGDLFTAQLTPEGEKVSVFGSYDQSSRYSGLLEFPVTP